MYETGRLSSNYNMLEFMILLYIYIYNNSGLSVCACVCLCVCACVFLLEGAHIVVKDENLSPYA